MFWNKVKIGALAFAGAMALSCSAGSAFYAWSAENKGGLRETVQAPRKLEAPARKMEIPEKQKAALPEIAGEKTPAPLPPAEPAVVKPQPEAEAPRPVGEDPGPVIFAPTPADSEPQDKDAKPIPVKEDKPKDPPAAAQEKNETAPRLGIAWTFGGLGYIAAVIAGDERLWLLDIANGMKHNKKQNIMRCLKTKDGTEFWNAILPEKLSCYTQGLHLYEKIIVTKLDKMLMFFDSMEGKELGNKVCDKSSPSFGWHFGKHLLSYEESGTLQKGKEKETVNALVVLNPATGDKKYNVISAPASGHLPNGASYSTNIFFTEIRESGGILLAGDMISLRGFDAGSGRMIWERKWGIGGSLMRDIFAVDEETGTIFVREGGLDKPGCVSALDIKTGRPRWTTPFPVIDYQNVVCALGKLYFRKEPGSALILNKSNGAIAPTKIETTPVQKEIQLPGGKCLVARGAKKVPVGSGWEAELAALDKSGKELWKTPGYKIDMRGTEQPCCEFCNGWLFAVINEGNEFVLAVWKMTPEGSFIRQPGSLIGLDKNDFISFHKAQDMVIVKTANKLYGIKCPAEK